MEDVAIKCGLTGRSYAFFGQLSGNFHKQEAQVIFQSIDAS